MNREFKGLQDASELPSGSHSLLEEAATPVETAGQQPETCRRGNALVLPAGAEIASHICLKSGHPVHTHIKTAIRNPFNPVSWIKPKNIAIVGLSYEEQQKYETKFTIAWALIGLGGFLLPAGFSYGLPALIGGLSLVFIGLVIRAIYPIWGVSRPGSKTLQIYGCGEQYLDLFPETSK